MERVSIVLQEAGITPATACQLLGITRRQWRRYQSGASPLPEASRRLLLAVGGGLLGELSPAWDGWRLVGGELVSPEGERYERTWFYRLPWYFAELREERARLREELAAALEEQRRLLQLLRETSAPAAATSQSGRRPRRQPEPSPPPRPHRS